MQNFREIFENYGADYEGTMSRFLGNETMYLRLLDMMFEDENLQNLGETLNSGDFSGAFAAAHTLKGAVGNMGLTPLYNAICMIVEPLREKSKNIDYADLYQKIESEFCKAEALREQLKLGV